MSSVLYPVSAGVYFVASVLYLLFLAKRGPRMGRWATLSLVGGFLVQTLAVLSRWIYLHHAPIGTFAESLSLFAWVMVAIYLVVEFRSRQKTVGAFVAPFAFANAAAGALLAPPLTPLQPILQSSWIATHITLSFVAYGFFTMAFAVSVAYLIADWGLRKHRTGFLYNRLPPLETLEGLGRGLAALGLPFMTVALISGSVWADKVWGSPWLWDTKLNLSLLTWLVYVGHFFVRNMLGWRGRRSAWFLVLAFQCLLVSYVIVRLFVPTVHRF